MGASFWSLNTDCLARPLVAQIIRNLPAMWEIQARSLDEEDALEEKIVTHCSILAWRTHSRGTWRAAVHGVTDSDMAEWLILSF